MLIVFEIGILYYKLMLRFLEVLVVKMYDF